MLNYNSPINDTKKYHPDLNNNNEDSEEKFKEINNAYEILSDPINRSYQ